MADLIFSTIASKKTKKYHIDSTKHCIKNLFSNDSYRYEFFKDFIINKKLDKSSSFESNLTNDEIAKKSLKILNEKLSNDEVAKESFNLLINYVIKTAETKKKLIEEINNFFSFKKVLNTIDNLNLDLSLNNQFYNYFKENFEPYQYIQ